MPLKMLAGIGGLQFRASFHDLMFDKAANDTAAEFIKRKDPTQSS